MPKSKASRRQFLIGAAALAVTPFPSLIARAAQGDGLLAPTPSDAEGPFYPVEMPADADNDLTRVMGREARSPGRLAYLQGRVTDREGQRIDGARVEIWQCDHTGVYHHPAAPGEPDLDFQGFGAMVTDRDGDYHFRTLRPVAYGSRTPHIHFRVTADGFDRLTTQLYVAEEAERNAADGLYQRHSEPERALVTTAFRPLGDAATGPVAARFDIVLG